MLKKSITYTNPFTEEKVTEEHFFHISKADLVQMEMEEHGTTYRDKSGKELTGMQAKLQRIVDSEDGKAIMFELKDMIRRSYGQKVGERFVKTPAAWEEFSSSEAYSQLIFDLCTDANEAAKFMTGIVPSNLEQEEAQKIAAQSAAISDTETSAQNGTGSRLLSAEEVEAMDASELKAGLADGRYKLS